MPVPEVTESFTGTVNKVTLGATKETGGTRMSTVRTKPKHKFNFYSEKYAG